MTRRVGKKAEWDWATQMRTLAEEEDMTPQEEFNALYRASRLAVRRNRLVALRLGMAISLVVAAALMWYVSAPVAPGIYPGKVLGAAYCSSAEGLRYPVVWVKAHPFARQAPVVDRFALLDEGGDTVAVARGATVELDPGSSYLARRVQGWVTLQPVAQGEATACHATVQAGTGEGREYDIGVLYVLGEDATAPSSDLSATVSIFFPETSATAAMPTSIVVGMTASSENTEITGVAAAGLPWMTADGVGVFQWTSAQEPVVREGLPVVPSGVSGTIRIYSPSVVSFDGRYFEWRSCSLPLALRPGRPTTLSAELVPWAGVLTREFFLYVPVEVSFRLGDSRGVVRSTAHDDRWARPWETFQTAVRPKAAVNPDYNFIKP